MKAYIDSSIVLRLVLGQPHQLREWPHITFGVSSGLLVATHHRALALAARASGFRVAGV